MAEVMNPFKRARKLPESPEEKAAEIINIANAQALVITKLARIEAVGASRLVIQNAKAMGNTIVRRATKDALDIMLTANNYKMMAKNYKKKVKDKAAVIVTKANIKAMATEIVKKAQVEADQICMDAYADVQETLFNAREEAREIIDETGRKAAAIIDAMQISEE
ncbi:hypothetical protein T484DRAFT_1756913 [Baffinella frigidus]|nr:hypothetical protein T484DRAFT_1756913 [Cryptophyta sp. CCMP2293]